MVALVLMVTLERTVSQVSKGRLVLVVQLGLSVLQGPEVIQDPRDQLALLGM
jgi:hypothetical protein